MSDGIHVSHHYPYSLNKMEYITVKNAGGNGIVTRSPRLEVRALPLKLFTMSISHYLSAFLYFCFVANLHLNLIESQE